MRNINGNWLTVKKEDIDKLYKYQPIEKELV